MNNNLSAVEDSSRFTAGEQSVVGGFEEDHHHTHSRFPPAAGMGFSPDLAPIEEVQREEQEKKNEKATGFSVLSFLSRLTACLPIGRVKPWNSRLQTPHNELVGALGLQDRDRPPSDGRVHPAIEHSGRTSARQSQPQFQPQFHQQPSVPQEIAVATGTGFQDDVPHDSPTVIPHPGTNSGTTASPAPAAGGPIVDEGHFINRSSRFLSVFSLS
jgi:hypothetical protein